MTSDYRFKHTHPTLGRIAGIKLSKDIIQFRSIPYALTAQRFARSVVRSTLPVQGKENQGYHNAVDYGPCSIQALDSFETDVRWNQLPPDAKDRYQPQSEDCLNITLTVPLEALQDTTRGIPFVVFIHGGAFVIGAGDRGYYDPLRFCETAIRAGRPLGFASINYRLGALGFMHSPEVEDLMPPNNGLYDQLNAFAWLRAFLPGFGGDPSNITAIGQSAGAASLSLHNSLPRKEPLHRRSIVLSGSSVVLVTMNPEQHHAEFLHQAAKLGIPSKGRDARDIALDLIRTPVDDIRDLKMVGALCSRSKLIPSDDWATMWHARHAPPNSWLESQIISSCTYDGSISYMIALGQKRKGLAKVFEAICRNRMKNPTALLDIYNISRDDPDPEALEKICQIVTDLGFTTAALSHAMGAQLSNVDTFMQLFDIPNPFPGLLEPGKFATHTWDIVALLGPYDHLVPAQSLKAIQQWRETIIEYCHSGNFPCDPWTSAGLSMLKESRTGLECQGKDEMAAARVNKLMQLAEAEGGEGGADMLWEEVVRFFLKTGSTRYAHEAEELLSKTV
ncbi:hypothetical protein C1H76_0741 [Elsinoe australis]|uniref:Carboxylesterase type B domain-containing protein n=1 Tax=Elsinoe australis TaxID=40998 RepID=A0A4U7BFQ6_9PEZI|nr:hypothetical protein C1H76_0741 [Elsinoe australis]